MARQIVWSKDAIESLEAIAEYIAQDSIVSAKKIVTKVLEAVRKLEQFPHLGIVAPEMSDPTIRQTIVLQYRLIYQVQEDGLVILSIVHARRRQRRRSRKH